MREKACVVRQNLGENSSNTIRKEHKCFQIIVQINTNVNHLFRSLTDDHILTYIVCILKSESHASCNFKSQWNAIQMNMPKVWRLVLLKYFKYFKHHIQALQPMTKVNKKVNKYNLLKKRKNEEGKGSKERRD